MSYISQQTSIRQFITGMVPKCYLPAIQRELVWDTEKIENLFDSITRGYPIGSLLLWNVQRPAIHDYAFYQLIREYDEERPHNQKANLEELSECLGILDGQQRTTALLLGFKGSFRQKRPRKWKTSPDAWVIKRLHLNLLHQPCPGKEERRFEFRFLSDEEAKADSEGCYWFRIGEVLRWGSEQDMRDWRRATPHRDNTVFEDNLAALWKAVEHPTGISYFLESNQDLNDVLTLFVRLNMGGEPLSYSDLLLSLATATWKSHDAREEVYALVEKINRDCGVRFGFTKDFVLKTLLVLNDGDVRFRTENIQHKAGLEKRWDAVKRVLPLVVRLIAGFGFSAETLSANNAVIPIAYYLWRTDRNPSYLTSKQFQEDRASIRRWLSSVLIGRAFSGQSDAVLTRVRAAMKDVGSSGLFPAEGILAKLKENQDIVFSAEAVESLVSETGYGSPLAHQVLSLVSPLQLDPSVQYHVDHIHPRAGFDEDKLGEIGVQGAEAYWFQEKRDGLPNLQLLPGQVNQSKLQTSYEEWLSEQDNPGFYRELGLIPAGASLKLGAFKAFYEARRKLLVEKLKMAVGLPSEASSKAKDKSDD